MQVTSKIIVTNHWGDCDQAGRQNSLITTENFGSDQFESGIFLNRSEKFRELNYDYTEQFIDLL